MLKIPEPVAGQQVFSLFVLQVQMLVALDDHSGELYRVPDGIGHRPGNPGIDRLDRLKLGLAGIIKLFKIEPVDQRGRLFRHPVRQGLHELRGTAGQAGPR